jgi:hypothetical protein
MCHCGDAWCDLSKEEAVKAETLTQELLVDPQWIQRFPGICDREYAAMNAVRSQLGLERFSHPYYDQRFSEVTSNAKNPSS